ncbi:asparagine synthase-related protein [Massilia sp. Se16.2.3]|uniref:asparagine synthase-related protein n=1 Tax=Massilia sp. Se16.2.3 TaxID=2709303 RepID=UPI0016034106|nr:asparagine synthase-related protein [Massilia sp. Se16.2.3]QNA99957.1 hypothetical protein G4G31_15945 [Massilia sp. Se16.2.3]
MRSTAHALGAVALVAAADEGSLHEEDGLLIACWGPRPDGLARLWHSQGAQACAALAGQFAFALFDAVRGEALLAVDRCASRPLFYRGAGRALLFASSSAALARHPAAAGAIDPQAIFDYLYLGGCGARPMFSGQRRLAPGECLHLRGGRVERVRYWRMRFAEHASASDPHERLIDGLSSALATSGDDGAGLLCAGGPASALLAAMLARVGAAPVRTYALGFGAHDRDILAQVRAASRRLGSHHREREVGPDDIEAGVVALARTGDGPLCRPPVRSPCCWARRWRARMACAACMAPWVPPRSLDAGAATAPWRKSAVTSACQARCASCWSSRCCSALAAGCRAPFARMRERIEASLAPAPVRLRRRNRLLRQGAAGVVDPAFPELVDPEAPAAALDQAWWSAQARSPVNRAIELELQGDLPLRVLPAFSAACAAAGLRPVLPYLDDALLSMAARLGPRHKGEAGARRLFDQALRALKAGRGTAHESAPVLPFGRWLQEEPRLRALAGDSLSDLARRRILRRDFLDLLLARRVPEDPRLHGETVWQLMMLERWLAQRSGDTRARIEPPHEALVLPA